jgi:hypothetical protein
VRCGIRGWHKDLRRGLRMRTAAGGRHTGDRRRTSSSSSPSASISASTPCGAARSQSGPISTVSPPLARACRAGNAERIVSPRHPRTRTRYRCAAGRCVRRSLAHHPYGRPAVWRRPPSGTYMLFPPGLADPQRQPRRRRGERSPHDRGDSRRRSAPRPGGYERARGAVRGAAAGTGARPFVCRWRRDRVPGATTRHPVA